MSQRARGPAYDALFALGRAAYAWKNNPQRTDKLKLWGDTAASERPAFYQFDGGDEAYTWTQSALAKRVIPARWFVYLDAASAQQSPVINAILDAFDAALLPNPVTGKQNLGGACDAVRIVGPVLREPGDLDGDGLLMVPLEIILP